MAETATWTDLIPDECIEEMVRDQQNEYFDLDVLHQIGGFQQHHDWMMGVVYTDLEEEE